MSCHVMYVLRACCDVVSWVGEMWYVMWQDVNCCHVMWCDVMWCDVVWCTVMKYDLRWCHVIWCDVMLCDGTLCGCNVMWLVVKTCDVMWVLDVVKVRWCFVNYGEPMTARPLRGPFQSLVKPWDAKGKETTESSCHSTTTPSCKENTPYCTL